VSKDRAQARAAREADAVRRDAAERERQAALADRARRRARRSLAWRRLRLWHHTDRSRRHRERWAALATLVIIAVLVAYFLTSSLSVVLLVLLVLAVGAPALIVLTFERGRR
jgi:Flp pilus assembly protein TadB